MADMKAVADRDMSFAEAKRKIERITDEKVKESE